MLIDVNSTNGCVHLSDTSLGPRLALSTWGRLLDALAIDAKGDDRATADLEQLRGLCAAADAEAFLPVTKYELSDQSIPRRVLQYSDVCEAAIEKAVSKDILSLKRLNPAHRRTRFGRYAMLGGPGKVGIWLGADLGAWREHGRSPLWGHFWPGPWGRAEVVRPVLRAWAADAHRLVADHKDRVIVALDLAEGFERDAVVAGLVAQLAALVSVLAGVSPSAADAEAPTDQPISKQ